MGGGWDPACLFRDRELIRLQTGIPLRAAFVDFVSVKDLDQADVQTGATAWSLALFATAGGMAASVLLRRLEEVEKSDESREKHEQDEGRSWKSLARVLRLPIILLLTALVVVAVAAFASSLGQSVASGQDLPPESLVASFSGVQAHDVVLEWIGDDAPPGLPSTAVLLGSKEGTVVLYDPASAEVWKVPQGEVLLRTQLSVPRN